MEDLFSADPSGCVLPEATAMRPWKQLLAAVVVGRRCHWHGVQLPWVQVWWPPFTDRSHLSVVGGSGSGVSGRRHSCSWLLITRTWRPRPVGVTGRSPVGARARWVDVGRRSRGRHTLQGGPCQALPREGSHPIIRLVRQTTGHSCDTAATPSRRKSLTCSLAGGG